ncbi:MAG: IS3 family transposase [Aggregatilineales bacterium]
MIQQTSDQASVTELCGLLEVSMSGYYAWQQEQTYRRGEADARLCEQIRAVFAESRSTYGSDRVTAALRSRGIPTSRKWVARLMR